MNHEEYIRIVPNSDIAVLLIHGIAGTPAHFRDLLPLIPAEWSVCNILLEGHGKTPRDFGAASMKKWRNQAENTLGQLLESHEKVILVGHSMGTLFSIRGAVNDPDRIAGLFLLNVPTRPRVRFSTALASLRIALGHVKPDDAKAMTMLNATSIRTVGSPTVYLRWIPRLLELLAEARTVRRLLPRLTVPCMTFQSENDELVSPRACKDLEHHPAIRNTVLPDSGHFQYGSRDLQLLQCRFRELLENVKNKSGNFAA